MLKRMSMHESNMLLKYAYEICRWHHERYDGNGYPDGLKGELTDYVKELDQSEDITVSTQLVRMLEYERRNA